MKATKCLLACGLSLLVSLSSTDAFVMRPIVHSRVSQRRAAPEVDSEIDETTRKWGLEGGLLKSAKAGNMDQAKLLLKKYGSAYLVTSITLAAISFSACFALVDAGVDVGSLLAKVGVIVDTESTANTAGTAAIAYIGSFECIDATHSLKEMLAYKCCLHCIDVLALIYFDYVSSCFEFDLVLCACAVHKAASPIRTVPVIALTPLVADFMGKDVDDSAASDASEE